MMTLSRLWVLFPSTNKLASVEMTTKLTRTFTTATPMCLALFSRSKGSTVQYLQLILSAITRNMYMHRGHRPFKNVFIQFTRHSLWTEAVSGEHSHATIRGQESSLLHNQHIMVGMIRSGSAVSLSYTLSHSSAKLETPDLMDSKPSLFIFLRCSDSGRGFKEGVNCRSGSMLVRCWDLKEGTNNMSREEISMIYAFLFIIFSF